MARPRPLKPRIRREDLAPGDCLCDHCIGKCCRYFSLPFHGPETWAEHDAVAGWLDHGQTLVYVEKSTWYVVAMTRCGYLGEDNRCGVYHDRPRICRDYTVAECEYDDDWLFDKVFETSGQLLEYAAATLPPRVEPPRPGDGTRAFAMALDPPADRDDFDAIRWYLAHGQSLIYVRNGVWCLAVTTPALRLTADLLRDLDRRRREVDFNPIVGPGGDDAPFDRLFETPAQVWEYAHALLPKLRTSPLPEILPPPPNLVTLDPTPLPRAEASARLP